MRPCALHSVRRRRTAPRCPQRSAACPAAASICMCVCARVRARVCTCCRSRSTSRTVTVRASRASASARIRSAAQPRVCRWRSAFRVSDSRTRVRVRADNGLCARACCARVGIRDGVADAAAARRGLRQRAVATTQRAESRCGRGRDEPSPGADVGGGGPSVGARCGGGAPSLGADVTGGAQSRCRCGRGEPSVGADVGGVGPVPVYVAAGERSAGADVCSMSFRCLSSVVRRTMSAARCLLRRACRAACGTARQGRRRGNA
jgi:hypothetical protein